MAGLEIEDLRHGYGRGHGQVSVLESVSLAVEAGETVAITGASGSGKSTLLHVVGGMLRPLDGHLRLDGTDPWRLSPRRRAGWRNSQIGFIFQFHHLLPELSALENVQVPEWIAGVEGRFTADRAREALVALGLAGRLHARPSELSGGEAQRVAIARALIRRPRLVLADEPTGNLDRESGRHVFDELVRAQQERSFVLLVATHDPGLAEACSRRLRLAAGRLEERAVDGERCQS